MEFKRRLAVESCAAQISIAKLALHYGLNANMLFRWRREYQAGKFGAQSTAGQAAKAPPFLPIVTPATSSPAKPAMAPSHAPGYLEIRRGDFCVRICGEVSAAALHRVLDCLAARE